MLLMHAPSFLSEIFIVKEIYFRLFVTSAAVALKDLCVMLHTVVSVTILQSEMCLLHPHNLAGTSIPWHSSKTHSKLALPCIRSC